MTSLDCLNCNHEITFEWDWESTISCPSCNTEFDLDFDTDYEDNIYGPWLVNQNV